MRSSPLSTALCPLILFLSILTSLHGSEVEVLDARTPWRLFLVSGRVVHRLDDGSLELRSGHRKEAFDPATGNARTLQLTPLPPTDWAQASTEMAHWPRHYMDEIEHSLGRWGRYDSNQHNNGRTVVQLCLRTRFGIADPAAVKNIKVTVHHLGGVAVLVNGREIGRSNLGEGKLDPVTNFATHYPQSAYALDDGTVLPALKGDNEPRKEWLNLYESRIRSFTVAVPSDALVKGANVLAVTVLRAPYAGPPAKEMCWRHAGIRTVSLTADDGVGVTRYAEADKGTRAWSADAVQQVCDKVPEKNFGTGGFKWIMTSRGAPVKGIRAANPFDPLLPVRLAAPRGGTASGQVVLSDVAGVTGVSATATPLKAADGSELPADALRIRFAQTVELNTPEPVHYCDALGEEPPAIATTVPVWCIAEIPAKQAPGWYSGTLQLAANGKTFTVPLQVLVTPVAVPAPRHGKALVGLTHAPGAIAQHYKADLWSAEHFELMEPTLAMMGQLGNDALQVPVIVHNQFGWQPLVHFRKQGDGLVPDFTILEKYLDLYTKYCGAPKSMDIYLWDIISAKRIADAYEGRQVPSRDFKPKQPLMVQVRDPANGTLSPVEIPGILDPGAEAFYRPLLDGVRVLVKRRGWDERCILVGMGGDKRPSKEAGDAMRQWAPYARWELLSHFSADPGSFMYKGEHKEALEQGKYIAIGDLEVGVKSFPWLNEYGPLDTKRLLQWLAQPREYMDLATARWWFRDNSSPYMYRTLPLAWCGNLGRLGMDFWYARDQEANTTIATSPPAMPGRPRAAGRGTDRALPDAARRRPGCGIASAPRPGTARNP